MPFAPTPIVDLGEDQVVEVGEIVTLSVGNDGATYSWSNGETSSIITVVESGTYAVIVTNQEGCSATDEVIIDFASEIESIATLEEWQIFPNPMQTRPGIYPYKSSAKHRFKVGDKRLNGASHSKRSTCLSKRKATPPIFYLQLGSRFVLGCIGGGKWNGCPKTIKRIEAHKKFSTMNHIPILIAGAGPTGLTMAAFLKQFDIPFRIIDKSISASSKSKALVVQARTLELFQQLGLAEKAVEWGSGVGAFTIHSKGKAAAKIVLTDPEEGKTPFPFAEVLPQDKTEELLIDYLTQQGVRIEWNTELTAIQKQADGCLLSLQCADGSTEVLKADYLVGADGAHSIVRHNIETQFIGGMYQQAFMLGDVEVDWEVKQEGLLVFLEHNFFCIFFPFKDPARRKFRVITLLPETTDKTDFAFLKAFIESNLSIPIRLSNPQWTSYYRVHHRCVEHFREGRIFLAGDAAHIHSPAGGQGMNTGIQDAHNLAWKLALVIKGTANDSLLDSYHSERWRVAQRLVNGTDRGFKVLTNSNLFVSWMRTNVMPHVMGRIVRIQRIQKLFFHFVSQTGINYEHHYQHFNYISHPIFKAGRRFPWCKHALSSGENIYDLLQPNAFHLFFFEKENNLKFKVGIIENLQSNFRTYLKIHFFVSTKEHQLLKHYQIESSMAVLVRPDMHIACVAATLEEVEAYWKTYFSYGD